MTKTNTSLALKELKKDRVLEELETEGILADEDLMGRIKAGVKQAKERKSRIQATTVSRERE